MLALRTACVAPATQQPYILDSTGGRDNSPEGHQVVLPLIPCTLPFLPCSLSRLSLLSSTICSFSPFLLLQEEEPRKTKLTTPRAFAKGAFSHAFVTHFRNVEDRRYYIEEDPAHLAFVRSLEGIVQNVRVVDYEPGVF